ncbi:MAG TPA: hypothetical protein VK483_04635 [Chitinophagaceae bacterium]|nr:hypothetical protein [Chitinophagaceae bacterium]
MNNTYILLRNNSESSPLSLEDLKRIGLLPTDLLWVECQSVCWQNPQEIPELKKLLNETAQPIIKHTADEPWEKYAPNAKNEASTDTLNYNSLNKKKEEPAPVKQESPNWQTEMKTANSINTLHSNNSFSINDTLRNEETKDPWIQNRVTKDIPIAIGTGLTGSLLKWPLKKIALYAGLVAVGALMMLFIKGTGSKDSTRSQPLSQQTKTVTTTPVEEPAPDLSTVAETNDQKNIPIEQTTTIPAAEQVIPASDKKDAKEKNEVIKKETTPLKTETPANHPAAVAENKEVKKAPEENIASKLQLKFNEYTVAAFGGIRNLKMTLQNNSRYLLDKVSVELHYLNPEGTVVKTETIDFNSVQAGDEATVAVKRSTRGVKLDYKITRIESKEMAANNSVTGESDQFSKN